MRARQPTPASNGFPGMSTPRRGHWRCRPERRDDRAGAFADPGLRQPCDVGALRCSQAAAGMANENDDRAIGVRHGDRMPQAVVCRHARRHDIRGLLARAERRREADECADQAQGTEVVTGVLFVIALSPSRGCVSVNDEAEIALVGADRPDACGQAVDPVDAREQADWESEAGANPSSGRASSFCATARTT